MDANGLKFWMLADESQWLLPDGTGADYDSARRALRLKSRGQPSVWPDNFQEAHLRLERVPQAHDELGNRAWWEPATGRVLASGARPGEFELVPPTPFVTDLAMGFDGVLYLAINGAVLMLDLRERWPEVTLSLTGFNAWRLAADPKGGVWVLDRGDAKNEPKQRPRLARVEGLPFPSRPYDPYHSDVFRPCPENPDEPRMRVLATEVLDEDETAVGIACSPQGRVAVLSWYTTAGDARVRLLEEDETLGTPRQLEGVKFPFSMAWVTASRLALLYGDAQYQGNGHSQKRVREAAVYEVDEQRPELQTVGDIYPLSDYEDGPFLHGTSFPPHYPTGTGTHSAPLYHLSLPSFSGSGEATGRRPLDSGSTQTTWHRLYLEAFIPPNCGIKVFLAAGNDEQHEVAADEWQEHRFGELYSQAPADGVACGAWVSYPSEIPFHAGLSDCPRERNRSGLFTILIQRPNRVVRSLRGRYLFVRVVLEGDGRSTPELAALRAYASRFSYLNRYLPELYQETEFGPEADEYGASTPADFLERFLDNFEGMLTTLEDRIASSYLLTDPQTTNEEALEWLGSWIGLTFDPAFPVSRRREFIQQAPQLYRRHGTKKGLELALDVATGNAVEGGEIIVLEDFRLRRLLATILGADLSGADDPLLPGGVNSGNSYVGDTLFLGDENRKEFLALFNEDLRESASEKRAIAAFFDQLAHRVTVLVHQDVEPQDLGLINRVVQMEAPAHVQSRVTTVSQKFMVGMASLVGVDTYLSEPQPLQPVRLGGLRLGAATSRLLGSTLGSQLGTGDRLFHAPALDPRFEGGSGEEAQVHLDKPVAVLPKNLGAFRFSKSFQMDARKSKASGGRKIKEYIWTLID